MVRKRVRARARSKTWGVDREVLRVGQKAKAVTSPGERRAFEDRDEHLELDRSESKRYRAIIARANYMSTERSDVQYSVKELSRFMAIPRTCDWTNVKRLARYLLGKPRTV